MQQPGHIQQHQWNIHAQYLEHILQAWKIICYSACLAFVVEKNCTAFKQYNDMSALATSTIHSYSLTYPTEKLVCRKTFGQLELRLDSWEIIVNLSSKKSQGLKLKLFFTYLCQFSPVALKRVLIYVLPHVMSHPQIQWLHNTSHVSDIGLGELSQFLK